MRRRGAARLKGDPPGHRVVSRCLRVGGVPCECVVGRGRAHRGRLCALCPAPVTPHSQPTAYDSHAPQPTVPPSRGLRATGGQHAAAHSSQRGGCARFTRPRPRRRLTRRPPQGRGRARAHARQRTHAGEALPPPPPAPAREPPVHPAAPVLPAVLAHRTLIFGTSATSRVDSAPAHFSSHFCARASPSKRFPAPQGAILSAPRSGRKF